MIEFLPNLIPISIGAGCGFFLFGIVWFVLTHLPKRPIDGPKQEEPPNMLYYE